MSGFRVQLSSRLKGWIAFLVSIFLLWGFVFYLAPWIRDSIPIMKELTRVAEERDIDTTAFFYAENKEFYEGERYLRESLDFANPEGYGVSLFFILGIVCCFVILGIGYHLLPGGSQPPPEEKPETGNLP